MTPRGGLAAALVAAAASVLGCVAVARAVYGFGYGISGVVLDVALLVPLAWLAVRTTGRRASAWIVGLAMALVLVLGHAAKIAFLGLPITFFDIGPGMRALSLLDGPWRAFAVACLTGLAGALAWALWPRRGRWPWWLALCGYAVVGLPLAGTGVRALPVFEAATRPALPLRQVGGIAFAFSSLDRFRRPDAEGAGIGDALQGRFGRAFPAAGFGRRNVHLVLLETTWDPLQLDGYRFSRDPWDPRFRRMWEAGGRSVVLTPVFGGGTANAEFEALCGLPADPGRIVFEGDIVHPLPCLPRLLREAGYDTAAYHAYKATFWSRDSAYRHIGFARYHASALFRIVDRDGRFLSDASMYGQVLAAHRQEDGSAGRPRFRYVVSLSAHHPYDRDRTRRPDLVTVEPHAARLANYANALAHATAAFMDYVESVRASDPDALIVAFGDHAPVLGTAPDPYVASGAQTDPVRLATTPLLVVDGRAGPVPMGRFPLYALPSRVLRLLGPEAPALPHAALAEDADHRMFLGQLLARTPTGWEPCGEDATPACLRARRHRRGNDLVREDLLRGARHTLRLADAMHLAEPVTMALDRAPCSLQVTDWGPRTAAAHQPFNRQPNGRSALWLKIGEADGDLELAIGGESAKMTVDGGTASASFGAPRFIAKPGAYPVTYRCGTAPAVEIGRFTVT